LKAGKAALQTQRRVISVDLPGFGLTGPSPQGDYRIDAYTRFVLRLMDTLGGQARGAGRQCPGR
jgi:pimeloyl-ACP methyl ester carboxylesterase